LLRPDGLGIVIANRSDSGSGALDVRQFAGFIGRIGIVVLFGAMIGPGLARADFKAGAKAYDIGDYATAFSEWQAAAHQGDARAEYGLGALYDLGKGVDADPKEAAKWYGLAARQGNASAANDLALLYAQGRGVDKDTAKAAQLWTVAAKAGMVPAQYNLALMYYRGDGVAKSYPAAASWFLQAAQKGDSLSQFAIGEMYRLGRGVPRDLAQAQRWLQESANNGNAAAIERLAMLGPDNGQAASAPGGGGMQEPKVAPATAPTVTPLAPPTVGGGDAAADTPAIQAPAQGSTQASSAPATPAAPAQPPAPPPAAPAAATQPSPALAGAVNMAPTMAPAATSPAPAAGQAVQTAALPPPTPATEPPAPMTSMASSEVLALEAAAKASVGSGAATGSARDASPIQLALPLGGADSGPGTGGAGEGGHYLVWLGTFNRRGDAVTYWAQQVQRYPDLLKHLRLSIRPVDLGPSQGVWYRVLGGPVADRAAADELCRKVASRSPTDDCRVFAD
jgi:TPR repeat protein